MYKYKNFIFDKILNETRNPIDQTIDSKVYDIWSCITLDQAIKEGFSIVIRDEKTEKSVAYMILRDYIPEYSKEESEIKKNKQICKYESLLGKLEEKFQQDYPNVQRGRMIKLVFRSS